MRMHFSLFITLFTTCLNVGGIVFVYFLPTIWATVIATVVFSALTGFVALLSVRHVQNAAVSANSVFVEFNALAATLMNTSTSDDVIDRSADLLGINGNSKVTRKVDTNLESPRSGAPSPKLLSSHAVNRKQSHSMLTFPKLNLSARPGGSNDRPKQSITNRCVVMAIAMTEVSHSDNGTAASQFTQAVAEILEKHVECDVNDIRGDSMLITVGTTNPCEKPEALACAIALELVTMLDQYQFTVVITSGNVFVVDFELQQRQHIVLMGECIDMAWHLVRLSGMLHVPIMVDESINYAIASESFATILVDAVRYPKTLTNSSISEVVHVYSIEGNLPTDDTDRQRFCEAKMHVSNAFQSFRLNDHAKALQLVLAAIHLIPSYIVVRLYRVMKFLSDPANEGLAPIPYCRTMRGWDPYESMSAEIILPDSLSELSILDPRAASMKADASFVRRAVTHLTKALQEGAPIISNSRTIVQDRKGRTWYMSSKILGRGTYGTVFVGMSEDGRLVAIKSLNVKSVKANKSINKLCEDTIREISLLGQLRHENVVSYLGCGVSESTLHIIMDYVSGGSLLTILQDFGSIPVSSLKKYCRGILRGLVFLHERGVVHRDIKPQNVLVRIDGMCQLTDFGTSGYMSQLQQRKGQTLAGTPAYMSPEQCRGEVTTASDIWAFGVLLSQLVTGVLPWSPDIDTTGVHFCFRLAKDESLRPQIPEDEVLPSGLHDLLVQCLERDPALRPAASELLLHEFLEATSPRNVVRPPEM